MFAIADKLGSADESPSIHDSIFSKNCFVLQLGLRDTDNLIFNIIIWNISTIISHTNVDVLIYIVYLSDIVIRYVDIDILISKSCC